MTERLEQDLFRAGRDERPSTAAKQHTLAAVGKAARARRSKRSLLIVGVAALAIAAGWAIFASSSAPDSQPLSLRAEPTRPNPETMPTRVPSAPASAPSKAPAPIPPKPSAHTTAPTPSAHRKPALSDEVRMLDQARSELRSGNASGALTTLDEYARTLRGGVMNAEATVLRIEAFSRAGRVKDADTLARRFVQANPHSALSDRARQFMKTDIGEKP